MVLRGVALTCIPANAHASRFYLWKRIIEKLGLAQFNFTLNMKAFYSKQYCILSTFTGDVPYFSANKPKAYLSS